MTKYESEAVGVSFELPDVLTVRQQLRFRSTVIMTPNAELNERYWAFAQTILTGWECEYAPDPAAIDLDTETDNRIADLIQYVANQTAIHMMELRGVPKNS